MDKTYDLLPASTNLLLGINFEQMGDSVGFSHFLHRKRWVKGKCECWIFKDNTYSNNKLRPLHEDSEIQFSSNYNTL